jgi:lipoprotein-anchoring transpeptidase ErfK/SrfK
MKLKGTQRIADRITGILLWTLTVTSVCWAQNATQAAQPARPRREVLVSIPDLRLAVIEQGNVIAYFPVAVGAEVSPSPQGEFEIVSRVANPKYYHNGVVMEAGRGNPVGTRWMGLNVKGYGIHGTNAPGSIGHATSHGCIRLRNRDVERLYTLLRVGDMVRIRGERDEEIASVFGGGGQRAVRETAQGLGQ